MQSRLFIPLGLALALVAGLLLLGQAVRTGPSPPSEAAAQRIVLIVVDTLRSDLLSLHGGPVETPNLQALAARGQVFSNALASFHQTTMSMAAMFTGQTPSLESGSDGGAIHWNGKTWCGLVRFASGPDDACVPRSLQTLAQGLRDAGYHTIGVQTNALLFEPSGFSRGFDEWVEVEPELEGHMSANGYRANSAVKAALPPEVPDRLFLYVHYMDVHDYADRVMPYPRAVELMDRVLAQLIQLLERRGVLPAAHVIFTSDHGEMLGEWGQHGHLGNPSYEPVVRVPLIVAPPTTRDPSRLVRTENLYALIGELAALRPKASAVLRPDELFLSELMFQTHREGRWKLYRQREGGGLDLFELRGELGERRVDPEAFPDVVAERAGRIAELGQTLAARNDVPDELTDEDRERLRRLGYLEPP